MNKVIFVSMKKLNKSIVLFIITMCMMTSCVTTQVTPVNVMAIHKGMTMDEIYKLFDKPDCRRFNKEGEEWEYRSQDLWNSEYKVVTVQFENERVVGMDSFVEPIETQTNKVDVSTKHPDINSGYYRAFSTRCTNEELKTLYHDMKEQAFDDRKMKILKLGVDHKLFTCKQAIKLMSVFSFKDDQMTALRILAPRITNKGRVGTILKQYPFLDDDKVYDLFMERR